LVPKDHQHEMAYGKSNGHVTDDVTSRDFGKSSRDPNTIKARYLENN